MAVDEMKNGVPPDDKEFAKDMQQLASSYLSPDSQTKVTVSDELRDSLTKMISGEKEATKTEVTVTSSLLFLNILLGATKITCEESDLTFLTIAFFSSISDS